MVMVSRKSVEIFTTKDGKEFTNGDEARAHEAALNAAMTPQDKYNELIERVRKTQSGRRPVYKDNDFRVWRIEGEGDEVSNRFICYFEGTYLQAIERAAFDTGFFGWGSGGIITPISIEKPFVWDRDGSLMPFTKRYKDDKTKISFEEGDVVIFKSYTKETGIVTIRDRADKLTFQVPFRYFT